MSSFKFSHESNQVVDAFFRHGVIDTGTHATDRPMSFEGSQTFLFGFFQKYRIKSLCCLFLRRNEIAGFGRHPMCVLSFPFDIATEGIRHRSADAFTRQELIQSILQIVDRH